MRTHLRTVEAGFTLLELMVGIAVFGILIAIGIPSFTNIVNNNRTTAQANELVGALNYARSEAVKRSDAVSVCSSADGATCAASADWSTGWIVFTDLTGAAGTLDAGDVPLQIWPATGGLVLNGGGNFVRYASTGMATAATAFSLYKANCSGDHARTITITITGRVSSARANCP